MIPNSQKGEKQGVFHGWGDLMKFSGTGTIIERGVNLESIGNSSDKKSVNTHFHKKQILVSK